jgi:hypothetical protein
MPGKSIMHPRKFCKFIRPRTACREVIRAVQALFESTGQGSVVEGTAAHVQARQRLAGKIGHRQLLESTVMRRSEPADSHRRKVMALWDRDSITTFGEGCAVT